MVNFIFVKEMSLGTPTNWLQKTKSLMTKFCVQKSKILNTKILRSQNFLTWIMLALSKIFCGKILGLSISSSIFRIFTHELKQGEILQSLRDLITNKIGDGARVGLKYPHVIRGKDWWNFWKFIDFDTILTYLIHFFQNFGWTIIQRNNTISKEYNICGNFTEFKSRIIKRSSKQSCLIFFLDS